MTARTTPATVARLIPAGIIVLVLVWALFPTLFTSQSAVDSDAAGLLPPSREHLFGTDNLGRDVFSRVVHGTSTTLETAGAAVLVALVGGVVIGLAAGSAGPLIEAALMRIVDVFIAVPGFLVALLVVTALGRSSQAVGIGVGIGSMAVFARVTRAQVLSVRSRDYVTASRLSGASWIRRAVLHILPNSLGPVLALTVLEIAGAIIAVSAFGFLGMGSPPPTPEWGLIIADGRNYLSTAWWITTLPGLTVTVVIVSVGFLGRQLQRKIGLV